MNEAQVDRGHEDWQSRLYDAQCAVHIAHQTGDPDWIRAASDRLHDVLVQSRRALVTSLGPRAGTA